MWIVFFLFGFLAILAQADVGNPAVAFPTVVPEDFCASGGSPAGYQTTPGCQNTLVRAGQSYTMRINSHGIRGPNYQARSAKDTFRILLVGSSLFVGPGLAEEKTIASYLQQNFKKNRRKVEVINASVEGYSTVHLASRLEEWVAAYSPHLVLLNISQQAFFTDNLYAHFAFMKSNGLPRLVTNSPAALYPQPLRSLLGEYPARRFRVASSLSFFGYRLRLSWQVKLSGDEKYRAELVAGPTTQILSATSRFLESSKTKFIVFLPDDQRFSNSMNINLNFDFRTAEILDRFTPNVSIERRQIETLLRQNNISFFSIPYPTGPNTTLPGDYHLNEIGTKRLAEEIYKKRAHFYP